MSKKKSKEPEKILPDKVEKILEQKRKKKLTPKQIKWLNEYLKTGNATQAAMKACDVTTYGGAVQSGHYMKKKLAPEIEKRLTQYGLTDEKVMTTHSELLDSDKDSVRMEAVKTYYNLKYKDSQNVNNEINIKLHF